MIGVLAIAISATIPTRSSIADAEFADPPTAVVFDIPAQSLETALERFMTVTKVSVIAESAVVAGRTSSALRGSFSPMTALSLLLAGTGLVPRSIGSGVYALAILPGAAGPNRWPRFVGYAAAIQRAVTAALCRREETRPTNYRTVMRLWINPTGLISHVELATPTDNPGLDTAIVDAIQRLDVGARPPSGLPQPVKLAIMPVSSNAEACLPDDGSESDPGR